MWDGGDFRRFREAHGVTIGFLARSFGGQTMGEVSSVFENERVLVAIPYDRVERYLVGCERLAATRDERAAVALAELKERIAARSKR